MKRLVKETVLFLDQNKEEWQNRYKGYLEDIWNNALKCSHSEYFRKPQYLSLYTAISDRKNPKYLLRYKGENVGIVTVKKNTKKVFLKSCVSSNFSDCPLQKNKEVDWDSQEAINFRSYWKTIQQKDIKMKSPEHYVENMLLKEFRKRKEKALRYIQPVLLHGKFFQMPTPLAASKHSPKYAEQNGGGIDMLARIKNKDGHSRLCVIEIKDKNINSESQKATMSQAIIYATFIAKLLECQPDWMEFFAGHREKRGRHHIDPFDIEVVTIMPKGGTEEFVNETLNVPGTNFTLHCHSLYYNDYQFNNNQSFYFTGTFTTEIKE